VLKVCIIERLGLGDEQPEVIKKLKENGWFEVNQA